MLHDTMRTGELCLVLLMLIGLCQGAPRTGCSSRRLVRYNVTFQALWSERDFPKQYPHFRPPAQWTKMLGRSHDAEYNIFSVGELADGAVKEFTETGSSTLLDQESQGKDGIYDIFYAPAITKGYGESRATFFADGRHAKVSLISHIVPSPDWFVGIDSVDLCENGIWKDDLSIDLDPLDGGTDQGYTFSAPNWPQEPPLPISVITSQVPSHPANSFFYPDKDALPTIGRIIFKMVSSYEWKDGVEPEEVSEDVSGEVDAKAEDEDKVEVKIQPEVLKLDKETEDSLEPEKPKWKGRTRNKLRNKGRGKGKGKGRGRGRKKGEKVVAGGLLQYEPVDCHVSEWAQWSSCSKTCGFGTRNRERTIIQAPMNYGSRCPNLVEDELCGSMRGCGWDHFNFGSKSGRRGGGFGRFRFGQGSAAAEDSAPALRQQSV